MSEPTAAVKPSSVRFLLVGAAVVTLALMAGWSVGKLRQKKGDQLSAGGNGALLFTAHCASCHGTEGRGDGGVQSNGQPPRDFAARPWRFEVSKESIRHVIRDGIGSTAMPAFVNVLSPAELDAVVDHVHHLATRGPLVEYVPTLEERLLGDAGFTNLKGLEPPPLTLSTADGKTVKLSSLRGRLVLLHFWGTGCVHCMKEIPALYRLQQRYPDRLAVLHVCADEDDAARAQKTLERVAPGATSHTESGGLGLARFEVQLLPTVWLIGPDGQAIGRASGTRDWQATPCISLLEHWLPGS